MHHIYFLASTTSDRPVVCQLLEPRHMRVTLACLPPVQDLGSLLPALRVYIVSSQLFTLAQIYPQDCDTSYLPLSSHLWQSPAGRIETLICEPRPPQVSALYFHPLQLFGCILIHTLHSPFAGYHRYTPTPRVMNAVTSVVELLLFSH